MLLKFVRKHTHCDLHIFMYLSVTRHAPTHTHRHTQCVVMLRSVFCAQSRSAMQERDLATGGVRPSVCPSHASSD